jgi:alpha-tubulin suppressor-like RCC1 family protein
MSAGLEHVCTIDDTGAKCWKNACLTKLEIPNLVNPTQIVSGERHACALDDEGVKCWGVATYQRYDLGTVPTLTNPKKIFSSPGGRNTCAIDDTGVKCWGDNTFGQLNYPVPTLVNPRQVAMTHKNFCALDDDGLKCWGDNSLGQLNVPLTLTNPRQISIGPRQITTGWGFDICALDSTEAECWSNNSGTWVQDRFGTPPTLTKPARIATGSSHACVVEDSGIKCWGANVRGQLNVPTELSDFTVAAPRTETSGAIQCPPQQ